jgi:tryptophan-rich sensory protein
MNMKKKWEAWCRRIRCAMNECSAVALLIGAGALMLCGVIVRGVCGSPYQSGMMMHFGRVIPPVWLMTLLWMTWYALLGAAFARVMFDRRCDGYTETVKYRGGMAYLAMLFLGFLWYPLFFAAGAVLFSAVLLIAILALCLACAIAYLSVCRPAAIILFCHAAWLLWLAVINIAVLFS